MPDIFLSYNREDQAVARRFAEAFGAEGFEVWWDATLKSGEAYDEVTEAALRTAKAVVVLWSPRSVVSRWVRAEATLADRNKTLVPCTIEPCDRPIMFELTQTAELSHWQGEPTDRTWVAFLGDVRQFLNRRVEPAAPAMQPQPSAPSSAQPETRRGKRGEAPSLAVLPFVNRSGLPEDEVFAFGMVEDIIDALSQSTGVRVVSSSATARFRTGAIPDLAAMAEQLGVRYVLEGNVRRSGEALRVTTQLVEASDGEVLWSRKFDRPLQDLAALQEDLVLDVARQLDVTLTRIDAERSLRKPSDLTAWEAVNRATESYRHFTADALEYAAEQASKAVALDPDYGLAHSTLAWTRSLLYTFMALDDQEVARVCAHAERALALDINNPQVLGGVAIAYCYAGLPAKGLPHAERAVRISPNSPWTQAACGTVLTWMNRPSEGIPRIQFAYDAGSDSGYYFAMLGAKAIGLMRLGQWAEAEAVEDEMLRRSPSTTFALGHKAILCSRAGRAEEAAAFMRQAQATEPDVALRLWEMRMNRWHINSPTRQEILDHLRIAWAATDAPT